MQILIQATLLSVLIKPLEVFNFRRPVTTIWVHLVIVPIRFRQRILFEHATTITKVQYPHLFPLLRFSVTGFFFTHLSLQDVSQFTNTMSFYASRLEHVGFSYRSSQNRLDHVNTYYPFFEPYTTRRYPTTIINNADRHP